MQWKLQKDMDVGTGNPIVARMSLGIFEIIDFADLPKEKKERLKANCYEIMKVNITPPHGGKLKSFLIAGKKKEEAIEQAKKLVGIKLSSLEFSDLIMLAIGAFSPLDGFMSRSDYKNVLGNMKLSNGILWPIPVTLSVSREEADKINEGRNIALTSPDSDEIVGTMKVGEKYTYDKKREAKVVFGTNDKNHPGVKRLYQKKDIYIGGLVEVFSEGEYPEKFPEYARPEQVREIFIKKGWKMSQIRGQI